MPYRSDEHTIGTEGDQLDPTGWDRTELRQALDWRRIEFDRQSATATGTSPVLVGSTGPFATLAGRHTLAAGGSATDAVLSTAFTQIALALGSWVSYAGLFAMVHYSAATRTLTSVSAGFATFAQENHPQQIPAAPQPSGRTALVPGFIAGAHAAHSHSGRLPWDQLWSPARYVVDRGIPVNEHLARMLALRADVLTRTAEGRAAFAPDGRLPHVGERLAQPQLATTLAALAEHGPNWMYHGPWAERFVSLVRREGGQVIPEDLAGYKARSADPARGFYAGHEIATLPPPDTGGTELLKTLALLEQAGVGEPALDPQALVKFLTALDGPRSAGTHSDYVVAVDAEGNLTALCHSINSAMWGTTGIVVDGIPIPDPAAFQQAALSRLAPGDHLPMPAEVAIALRDGDPVLACSSIGVGLHPATVLGLHRFLSLGQPLKAVVDAPLVHGHSFLVGDSVTSVPAQDNCGDLSRVVDDRFPAAFLTAAREAGHAVSPRAVDDPGLPRGFWAAIATDPHTGGHTAARTPYGQGPIRTNE